MYELMMEMGWRSTSFSTADWVQQYATRKYGPALANGPKSAAGAAWEVLRRNAYASEKYAFLICACPFVRGLMYSRSYWGQVRVPLEYTPSFGFYNTNNPVPPVNATAMTEVLLEVVPMLMKGNSDQVVGLMLKAASSAPAGTVLSGPFLYDLTDFSRQARVVGIFRIAHRPADACEHFHRPLSAARNANTTEPFPRCYHWVRDYCLFAN
jgi:hypothetical protein